MEVEECSGFNTIEIDFFGNNKEHKFSLLQLKRIMPKFNVIICI